MKCKQHRETGGVVESVTPKPGGCSLSHPKVGETHLRPKAAQIWAPPPPRDVFGSFPKKLKTHGPSDDNTKTIENLLEYCYNNKENEIIPDCYTNLIFELSKSTPINGLLQSYEKNLTREDSRRPCSFQLNFVIWGPFCFLAAISFFQIL